MKTIALRFGENIAPEKGTILAHQDVIDKYGYVWYGKFGSRISEKVMKEIMENEVPKILLIQSGKNKRYWATIEKIIWEQPKDGIFPMYYKGSLERFKTWFKVIKIEEAPVNVMSLCTVASSGAVLGEASKKSMSPYFIINAD